MFHILSQISVSVCRLRQLLDMAKPRPLVIYFLNMRQKAHLYEFRGIQGEHIEDGGMGPGLIAIYMPFPCLYILLLILMLTKLVDNVSSKEKTRKYHKNNGLLINSRIFISSEWSRPTRSKLSNLHSSLVVSHPVIYHLF